MARVRLVQFKIRRKWVDVWKHWRRRKLDVNGVVLWDVIVCGGSGQGVKQQKWWYG